MMQINQLHLFEYLLQVNKTGVVVYEPQLNSGSFIEDFATVFYNGTAEEIVADLFPGIYRTGRKLREYPWYNESIFGSYVKVMITAEPFSYEMHQKNRCYRLEAIKYEQFLVISFTDITDEANLREQNKANLALFESVFHNPAVGIGICDINGTFIKANEKLLKITGYGFAELIGKNIQSITVDDDVEKTMSLFSNLIRGEIDSYNTEKKYLRKDGSYLWAILNVTAIRNDEGRFICAAGIITDITERKTLEQQMQQRQAEVDELIAELLKSNQFKNQLLGIIAHDLNGPLFGCVTAMEMTLEEQQNLSREQLIAFIQKLHESSQSVSTLLRNLLSWSLTQMNAISFKPIRQPVDKIAASAWESLKMQASKKNVTASFSVAGVAVKADRDMLEAIFRNLLSNAIKFSTANAQIQVSAIETDTETIICIKDEGVGMAESEIQSLYNTSLHHSTFGTSGEKGSGLGFSVCIDFVKKHGGTIEVISQKNAGTTVRFTLPR